MAEAVTDLAKPFVSKRGRPSLEQAAAIEEAIVAAGRASFLANGYANASMEAIAAALSMSKKTLYARYPDKAALFNAVVTERLAAWRAESRETPPEMGEGLSSHLLRLGGSFLKRMRDPEISAFHHLISSEAGRFPELAKQFYNTGFQGAVERLAGYIKSADDGQWPISDPSSVARAFLSALIGWFDAESLRREITDEDCQIFVARLVAIFTAGRSSW